MNTGLIAARDAIRARTSFLLTSHARPDGDSIGSQLAMAFALDTRTIRADAEGLAPMPQDRGEGNAPDMAIGVTGAQWAELAPLLGPGGEVDIMP